MASNSLVERLGRIDPGYRNIAVIGLLFAVVPLVFFKGGASYLSRVFTLILVYCILAVALNIVYGHADVLFLCVGALTGIGAYFTLLAANAYGLSPWFTALVSPLVVGTIGGVISYAAARRRFTLGLSAIATLAIQLSVIQALIGFSSITGGTTGLPFSGLELTVLQNLLGFAPITALYYFLWLVLLVVLSFYWWLVNSKHGLAYEVIRQDKVAASASGIAVVNYQSLAGFISGAIIGFVGPFYGQVNGTLLPGMFAFTVIDVTVLIILVIGGLRTITGPVIGAVFILFLEDYLSTFATWRSVIFGILLMVLFLYFREGIVARVAHLVRESTDIGERWARRESS